LELARASENVQRHLDGKAIVKEIVVPGRLVNLVVR
jgi:leucyl-tRNA synthetase